MIPAKKELERQIRAGNIIKSLWRYSDEVVGVYLDSTKLPGSINVLLRTPITLPTYVGGFKITSRVVGPITREYLLEWKNTESTKKK